MIELGSCAFRQWRATHSHCSKLHGYKLDAKFWFCGSSLDDKNWIVDFGGLKELKKQLQNQFDHTLVVAADDPLLPLFNQLHAAGGCDLRIMPDGVGIERTAEYCFKVADAHVRAVTNGRCWVQKVEVFEHELNSAIYSTEAYTNVNTVPNVLVQTNVQPEVVSVVEQAPTQPTTPPAKVPIPARVGSHVTTGKGEWFAGTTWA